MENKDGEEWAAQMAREEAEHQKRMQRFREKIQANSSAIAEYVRVQTIVVCFTAGSLIAMGLVMVTR